MTTVTLDVPEPVVPLLDAIGDRLSLVLEMGMSRLAPVSFLAYSEAVSFLTQSPSAEDIIEFRFSAEIEERVKNLLGKKWGRAPESSRRNRTGSVGSTRRSTWIVKSEDISTQTSK